MSGGDPVDLVGRGVAAERPERPEATSVSSQSNNATTGLAGFVWPSQATQAFFPLWPPNPLRMAESTLSAKSSRPREANRE